MKYLYFILFLLVFFVGFIIYVDNKNSDKCDKKGGVLINSHCIDKKVLINEID